MIIQIGERNEFDDLHYVVRFEDGKYLQRPEEYGAKYKRTEDLDKAVKIGIFSNVQFGLIPYNITEPYKLVKVKEKRTYEFMDDEDLQEAIKHT